MKFDKDVSLLLDMVVFMIDRINEDVDKPCELDVLLLGNLLRLKAVIEDRVIGGGVNGMDRKPPKSIKTPENSQGG